MSTKHTSRGSVTRPSVPGEVPKKKNFRLHQSKIDRASKLLGTRTETETIEQALDFVTFGNAVLAGIDGVYGSGLQNVVDDPD